MLKARQLVRARRSGKQVFYALSDAATLADHALVIRAGADAIHIGSDGAA